jgi:hypothetical protein
MYLSLGIKGTGTGDKNVPFPLTTVFNHNALAFSIIPSTRIKAVSWMRVRQKNMIKAIILI